MRVHKYIPDRLYGFVIDGQGREAFFHLGSFDPGVLVDPPTCASCTDASCAWVDAPPPPILGEVVEVEVDLSGTGDRAPRASRVHRLEAPKLIQGRVETFDSFRGYGFIIGADGVSYHLHKSEVLNGRLPTAEQKVSFFAGTRQGRPRACHVKVCP